VIELACGITVYPAREDGGRWRAVWYENDERLYTHHRLPRGTPAADDIFVYSCQAQARDPQHKRTWVVLADGAEHQLDLIRAEAARRGVTIHIVIDIIHVLERLWKAAWSSCARYLTSLRDHLRYDQALAAGWPIATGVIEGACRNLIGDRLHITGARWGLDGAVAILTLRAVISNAFTLSSHLSGLTCRESKSGKMPRAARGLPRMSVAGSKRRPAAKRRHVAAGLPVSRFWLSPGP